MQYLQWTLVGLQVLAAIALIFIIAIQSTKSEQSGGGMGIIGGQASTSVHRFGLDAQLTRVTSIIAVSFFLLSLASAYVESLVRHAAK